MNFYASILFIFFFLNIFRLANYKHLKYNNQLCRKIPNKPNNNHYSSVSISRTNLVSVVAGNSGFLY